MKHIIVPSVIRSTTIQTTCLSRSNQNQIRWYDTHAQQLQMLSPPDLRLTFPEGSKHLNEQHFYQVSIKKWLEKSPRPLTLSQITQYSRHMSKQKVIQSANHVAEELTIRFAHRIRQMQVLPYRLMGHPALLDTYEQYIDSFELLRRVGEIKTLGENDKFVEIGQHLLEKHTLVVTNVIRGVREIVNHGSHKPDDEEHLNHLVRTLVTSRLSRRVMVKQHASLTNAWKTATWGGNDEGDTIGEVKLDCTILNALNGVEQRTKEILAKQYGIDPIDMPRILLESDSKDCETHFPYIMPHLKFALGELLLNSMEACLHSKVNDPIIVTVSATPEFVIVRISDHGGGICENLIGDLWSFTKPDVQIPVTLQGLANHQFFDLLFPTDACKNDKPPNINPPASHFGLGLALARLYLEYWGGTLEIHSLEGFGCDAVLRISRNGKRQENLRLES